MFSAILSLPQSPREAKAVADAFDSLVRALREWPAAAWEQVRSAEHATGELPPAPAGLFERLVPLAAPLALDPRHRDEALRSAQAAADVLRVMWPDPARSGAWSTLPTHEIEAGSLILT